MKVRQLLGSFAPVRLSATANVREAVVKMVECGCGSVIIEDKQGSMLGIFTERDLMTRVIGVGLDPDTIQLKQVMSSEVFTAGPDDLVNEVHSQLRERHIRHVPVVERGEVIAVLSVRDLIRAHMAEQKAANKAMGDYIRGEAS